MSGLPWVRLDSSIASNDKMLSLLSDPSAKRWQAASSYMFALAWSGQQGTDGRVPSVALPFVHGTQATARLLVKYGLWDEAPAGFQIHNFGQRQQTAVVTAAVNEAKAAGAARGNCKRHHGELCWKDGQCSRKAAAS